MKKFILLLLSLVGCCFNLTAMDQHPSLDKLLEPDSPFEDKRKWASTFPRTWNSNEAIVNFGPYNFKENILTLFAVMAGKSTLYFVLEKKDHSGTQYREIPALLPYIRSLGHEKD